MIEAAGELVTQKQVYQLISIHPGLNLSTIAEHLNIRVELARYHLQYLEKHDLLTTDKEEGFRRYYVKGDVGVKDKKYLSLFRQEMLLKIVLYLIKHPYARHRDILEEFDISRSLLSYHLKKLIKKGIIIQDTAEKASGYSIINQNDIVNFLIKYEPYKILEGLTDTWADFTMQ